MHGINFGVAFFLLASLLVGIAAQANSDMKSIIKHNPDGTFTVRKEPRHGDAKDSKAKEGLVISPQVVVPLIPALNKKQ